VLAKIAAKPMRRARPDRRALEQLEKLEKLEKEVSGRRVMPPTCPSRAGKAGKNSVADV